MRKPPRYQATIKTLPLSIGNASRDAFRAELEKIPFLGYEVEKLSDGRSICITKPGGKRAYGRMQIHDFMVWIVDQTNSECWRIGHEEIKEDLREKIRANQAQGCAVVEALKRVHDGEDPNDIMSSSPELGAGLPGESAELLLKVYKWIWGQEDCNYPTGEGRSLSMNGLLELLPP